jgi:hypothetical protein
MIAAGSNSNGDDDEDMGRSARVGHAGPLPFLPAEALRRSQNRS